MDMEKGRIFLSDLVKMDFPQSVLEEVKSTISLVRIDFDFNWFDRVFRDLVDMYSGRYPGYKKCNTRYHDLKHTTDVLLAMARLIHGAHASGENVKDEHISLGLISAMLHDTGYLQRTGDDEGTGAKYALVRVERSLEFMAEYFDRRNFDMSGIAFCSDIIRSTDMLDGRGVKTGSRGGELFGKLMAAADILGQVADRTYLEKLLLLFQEFSEVQLLGYTSELDLLQKTLDYYEDARFRLEGDLAGVGRYMLKHFQERWSIDSDIYEDAISSNIAYLKHLLKFNRDDYREKLRRGGVVEMLLK